MKIYIQTLGCKVNQYETQALETLFTDRGHSIAEKPDGCDTIIINTCAVTAESERKSRQAVRHLKKSAPDAIVAVCGCCAQINPDSMEKLGADLIAGSGGRKQFVSDLEEVFAQKQRKITVDEALKRRMFEELPAGGLSGRTRAMLKIQDGCSNFCTYCIIPYARGPVRSMPAEEAALEAARLDKMGYKELVITGIEIASYGKDLKTGETLADVLCMISDSAPNCRLRLGSLEPRVITEEFCQKMSQKKNLCHHFHLSLQSGCDETLKRMHRKYDTARFFESVCLLRKYFPDCGMTADLITGFPGETDEEFEKTLEFITKCGFSSMHIFPYSERPGTPAAAMENSVEKRVRQERAAKATEIAKKMEEEFLQKCVGTKQTVLFEQEKDGASFGHCGNYCRAAVDEVGLHNEIVQIYITEAKNGILFGTI